jgi:hypothetical protein
MPNASNNPLLKTLTDFLSSADSSGQAQPTPQEVLFALALSFALNCLIAAVYKKTYRGARYSQDYVHTLLILGTVVSVVIMVVRGSQSTAFGMFAAFSIIRFRRSVSQARDIGFIFLAMATGLAVGAQAYVLAAITTPVLCAMIWLLGVNDAFAARRLSHILRIRVGNELDYDKVFSGTFADFLSFHQLDSVETVQAGMMTELRYEITMNEPGRLGAFVARLQQLNGNNRVLITSTGESSATD